MLHLTDIDLISRLKNFEDHFVERKTSGDDKYDWVKTAVAFANSAPIDFPCVLYIGVKNNGELEEKQIDLDGLQKKFNREMMFVYPRIPYLPKVLNIDGRQCLAVIVPGSADRPHFAGLSYIRAGSETREASEEQFENLITARNSKTRKILEFKGKRISVFTHDSGLLTGRVGISWAEAVVVDCNQFWVVIDPKTEPRGLLSVPLARVELTLDTVRNRLALEIRE